MKSVQAHRRDMASRAARRIRAQLKAEYPGTKFGVSRLVFAREVVVCVVAPIAARPHHARLRETLDAHQNQIVTRVDLSYALNLRG